MIEGVIFDLDGTLLDSMPFWQTVPEKYLSSIGIIPDENINSEIATFSIKECAQYFIKKYNLQLELEEVLCGINNIIEDFYLNEVQLKKGAKELIEYFAKNKIEMSVATSSMERLARAALKRLCNADFKAVVSSNDCKAGKETCSEVYEKALDALGVSKEKVWVFEDALFAIKTAKKAGFKVCAVKENLETSTDEIKKYADLYVEDLSVFLKETENV